MRAFVCPCARACPTPLGPSGLSALDNIRPSLRRPALGGARREFITGKTTTPALLAECQQRARPAVRVRPPAPSLACQPPSRQPAGARAPARSPDSAWRNSPLAGRQASERLITSRLATSRQRRQKATSERKRQPSLALSGSLVFQPASQPAPPEFKLHKTAAKAAWRSPPRCALPPGALTHSLDPAIHQADDSRHYLKPEFACCRHQTALPACTIANLALIRAGARSCVTGATWRRATQPVRLADFSPARLAAPQTSHPTGSSGRPLAHARSTLTDTMRH